MSLWIRNPGKNICKIRRSVRLFTPLLICKGKCSPSSASSSNGKTKNNREIKIHVYGIRQTADVSWKFLRIENKQIKTVQNDSCGQNWHKTTYFCVEAINSKRKIRGKLGHVVQIHVCRLALTWILISLLRKMLCGAPLRKKQVLVFGSVKVQNRNCQFFCGLITTTCIVSWFHIG